MPKSLLIWASFLIFKSPEDSLKKSPWIWCAHPSTPICIQASSSTSLTWNNVDIHTMYRVCSVCMCEGKLPCSRFSEVKSSWPLIQLWFQVCCTGPKLPTCVCHFCQQPLRHGGQNVPPHPLFLQVSLDLYTRSSLSGPREACLLEGTWRKMNQNHMSKVKRPTGRNRKRETLNDFSLQSMFLGFTSVD